MDSLSREQRDVLLDYYFDCASDDEVSTAKSLIVDYEGAAEFYEKLGHSLSALDQLDHETDDNCPDHIVENTLAKLYEHHEQAAGEKLGGLLDVESQKIVTTRPSFWRSMVEVGAIAAMIMIFSGVFVPVTRHMRAQAWKTACNFNLSRIAKGIETYADDNNGNLPVLATAAGAPWWKVGSKETPNNSNTRNLWLLVQNDYLRPEVFVCPGRAQGKATQLDKSMVKKYRDFPDRRYVTYSFKLICDPSKAKWPNRSTPLMADSNPIFDKCGGKGVDFRRLDRSEFDPIKLCEKLIRANSINHRSKGQNVMFSDGSTRFLRKRFVGNSLDDIFTVTGLSEYRGVERPSCESDIFLVP